MIYKDGTIYIGSWSNGLRTGIGKQITPEGSIYSGTWKNNKLEGHGKFTL